MKKNITFIFILFCHSLIFGQKTKPLNKMILKTEPFVFWLKSYNIGLEYEIGSKANITLGFFKSPCLDFYDLTFDTPEDYFISENISGFNLRGGLKLFPKKNTKKKRFYIEPQFRIGKMSADKILFPRFGYNYYEKSKRCQLFLLIGMQHRILDRIFLDYYIGFGKVFVNATRIITETTDSYKDRLGEKINLKDSYKMPYIGISIGIGLAKVIK